jgi:hypothetical protein
VCLGLLLGHSVPPGLVDKLNGLSGVNTPSALSGFIKGASGGDSALASAFAPMEISTPLPHFPPWAAFERPAPRNSGEAMPGQFKKPLGTPGPLMRWNSYPVNCAPSVDTCPWRCGTLNAAGSIGECRAHQNRESFGGTDSFRH